MNIVPESRILERRILPSYNGNGLCSQITALMRRKGRKVNVKRVQRVRREAGLQVRKKQKRRRRLGPTDG
jgi:hypothetical protein